MESGWARNMNPCVSIVTPSYNQARFLEQTINSILDQDYSRIEYIVIDGGSTDGSLGIIQKYSEKISYWISEPDHGQSHAINKGWRRATGSILAWMNADDWYSPGAVSKAVEYLLRCKGTGLVYGDCEWVDSRGIFLRRQNPPPFDYADFVIGMNDYIPSGSTFIKRAVYENIGGLDETMHYTMDHDYWLRAGLVAQIDYLPEVLSSFRVYPEAKTWRQSSDKARDIIYMYEKLLAADGIPERVKAQKKVLLSKAYLRGAAHYRNAHNNGMFIKYLGKSLVTDPLHWSRSRIKSLFSLFV
jgi:glycosyltransferase involved in cell wall biosynthesis